MSKQYIEIECESCKGTGLYCGFAEPDGTARVCQICSGKGGYLFYFTPFTKRKNRKGISIVRSEMGNNSPSVSYSDFKGGKLPRNIVRGK